MQKLNCQAKHREHMCIRIAPPPNRVVLKYMQFKGTILDRAVELWVRDAICGFWRPLLTLLCIWTTWSAFIENTQSGHVSLLYARSWNANMQLLEYMYAPTQCWLSVFNRISCNHCDCAITSSMDHHTWRWLSWNQAPPAIRAFSSLEVKQLSMWAMTGHLHQFETRLKTPCGSFYVAFDHLFLVCVSQRQVSGGACMQQEDLLELCIEDRFMEDNLLLTQLPAHTLCFRQIMPYLPGCFMGKTFCTLVKGLKFTKTIGWVSRVVDLFFQRTECPNNVIQIWHDWEMQHW